MNDQESASTNCQVVRDAALDQRLGPPEYDTLSIAPPGIDDIPTSSRASNSEAPRDGDSIMNSRRKSMKERWQQLKEEDEERKAAKLRYVTREEADKIAGLDRHRERERRKAADGKKRGKGILGAVLIL